MREGIGKENKKRTAGKVKGIRELESVTGKDKSEEQCATKNKETEGR